MARDVSERRCSVEGCANPAARSIAGKRAQAALRSLKLVDERRAHLCRDHYKQFRKATKQERDLDRLGW